MNYYARAQYDDALQQFKSILLLEPNNKIAKEYSEKILLKKDLAESHAMGVLPQENVGAEDLMTRTLDKYQDKRTAGSYNGPNITDIFGKRSPGDYVVAAKEKIEKKFPVEMSGEYRLAFGANSKDFFWKKANADKQGVPREKNYRYVWGDKKYNTYDEKIYDSLELNLATKNPGPLNIGTQVVMDPWSFIGHAKVNVTSVAGDDSAEIDLKYWSNTRSTINEVYRTDKGNIIHFNEIKVVDGKTTPGTSADGLHDWAVPFNNIPEVKIDRIYRPVRKLFADYTRENIKLHVFPISDQYEALNSDDPLRLSNNRVYWEESAWLDSYEASRVFTRAGNPLKKGRWVHRWSYVAKSSSDNMDTSNYLTFLRGASFAGELGPFTLEAVSATPLDYWNEYDRSSSVDNAVRLRYPYTDDLDFGFTYTNKLGLAGGSIEASNNVWGVDVKNQISPNTSLYGEFSGSTFKVSEANGITTSLEGVATTLGLDFKEPKEAQKGFYRGKVYVAYMDKSFYPALSNYRYTRQDDQYWAKNVYFEKLNPEDEVTIWGNGMDRGRLAAGLGAGLKSFAERLDTHFDLRNVYNNSGVYIETVGRAESTARLTNKLTSKLLAYYQHLPDTQAGIDPIIYDKTMYSITDFFSEDDSHPLNSDIEADKDPSVGSFGLGLKYDFTNTLSLEGIFQRTNDPLDFPRSLLNDVFVTEEIVNGVDYDKVVPFLYDQSFFGLPPYNYYNIYKSKFTYWPLVDKLKLTLSYTKNDNKFATGIDDNVNHIGIEADYTPNKKWNFWAKYTYSKIVDLTELVTNHNNFLYQWHSNIFLGARYNLREDESFTLLFGEFVGYDYDYLDSVWSLSTVDTQHIFRLFYKKKF
ncbi:MAG: hypothetical protein PHU91_01865 [Candidatus Omnitrophica bacterium]|nr:hypothetical protein [Candidatus Omnitrophota bacterium]MDD5236402.1 hypothetical protein [Candidatus Omnitrophota bacterium]MDD5611009.1 hypothetical protein [Candidatus Omnitrophota bacterium]